MNKEARQAARQAAQEAYVKALVDQAPPLSEGQRARLRMLLGGYSRPGMLDRLSGHEVTEPEVDSKVRKPLG